MKISYKNFDGNDALIKQTTLNILKIPAI